jgi:aryl-alcohol dehydrogenase-like predicted oxidoreductase
MEVRPLGHCGLKVTPLSFGAMTFGDAPGFMKGVSSADDEARRMLDRALDAGINLVDTANVYSAGQSEERLGEWLAGKRESVLVATKCRFSMGPGPHDQGLSRKHILAACEASLRRLKMDYVDLYQVHMQDSTVPIDETLRALDDLVYQGKVRYIGCSNYTGYRLTESLWASEKHDFVRYESVQLQYSLICRDAEREVLPACRTFGLGVLAWSPLGRGFLSGKYKRGDKPPEGSRLETWADSWRMTATEKNFDILETVRSIAEAHNTSPGAVSLAWVLAKPLITTTIIGARTMAQLEDNLACLNVKLTPDEIARLDLVSRPDYGYPYEFIGGRQEW